VNSCIVNAMQPYLLSISVWTCSRFETNLEPHIQFRPDAEEAAPVGEEAGSEPKLHFYCGQFDLTDYMNAWEGLPPLKPLADIDPEPPQA
jgi:hypothetical protein